MACILKYTRNVVRLWKHNCSLSMQKCSFQTSKCAQNYLKDNFYITTPIFYVNAAPHLGHLYTVTIADALYRYKMLQGKNCVFSSGTDEHGLKIQQAASKSSMSTELFCSTTSEKFKSLFDTFNISYTKYIRTTDAAHVNAVQNFYTKLVDRGHVYKGDYSGWYCISDESFLTESQVGDQKLPSGETIKTSAESGNPVEWSTECNYKFRLSQFQDDLLYWLKQDGRVTPSRFLDELRGWIQEGLVDLSISRPMKRVSWGVPVPGDPEHSVYVWVDALVNYLTAVGYPSSFSAGDAGGLMWPPDVQVMGKDILKFHGIYWPALLMAAGLEPPRQLLVHCHWTVEGVKMSKSIGNVVCPHEAMEVLTADGVRYCLLRQSTPHADGTWREDKMIMLLNAELADSLGNLVHRCTAKTLNPLHVFPALHPDFLKSSPCARDLSEKLSTLKDSVAESFESCNFYLGIESIMVVVRLANLMVQKEQPWELKDDPNRQGSVVHLALSAGRAAAIMLQPVVPDYSCRLLDMLGVDEISRSWQDIDILPSENHTVAPLGKRSPPFKKIKLQ